MKSFIFSVLVSILTVLPLQAQNEKLDSLLRQYTRQPDDTLKVQTLSSIYNIYLYSEPEKAKEYALKEIDLSKKLDFQLGVAQGNYHMGVYYNNRDHVDSARFYYNKSLELYEKMNHVGRAISVNHGLAILDLDQGNYERAISRIDNNLEILQTSHTDSSILATSFNLKSYVLTTQGKYKLSLENALKAVEIHDQMGNDIRKADALGALAYVEFVSENYQKSNDYNKEAYDIYKANNDKVYQAQAANDIGNAYIYLENYSEASKYLTESIALAKETNFSDIHGTSLTNLGKVRKEQKLYDEAISLINKALKIHRETGSQDKCAEALIELGKTYAAFEQPNKAIRYLSEAISISSEIEANKTLANAYKNRSKSFEAIGNFKIALNDFKEFSRLNDSIYNIRKSQQMEELRTIYDIERKEKEIELQKSDIQLLQEKDRANTLRNTLLISGLIGMVLLFSLVYYGVRQKIKRTQLEKEKLDQDLQFKSKELTTHALHLAQKNEVLENLKTKAKQLKDGKQDKNGYQLLIQTINFDQQHDKGWDNFIRYFENVHADFNKKAQSAYPNITAGDLRLMALLKMNLSSKEIANILSISPDGIKKARQRLRKKLGLTPEDSLEVTVMSI
ncbi:MAG: tetratricopeptide repeat protein [Bacteroidota bacterium]